MTKIDPRFFRSSFEAEHALQDEKKVDGARIDIFRPSLASIAVGMNAQAWPSASPKSLSLSGRVIAVDAVNKMVELRIYLGGSKEQSRQFSIADIAEVWMTQS